MITLARVVEQIFPISTQSPKGLVHVVLTGEDELTLTYQDVLPNGQHDDAITWVFELKD